MLCYIELARDGSSHNFQWFGSIETAIVGGGRTFAFLRLSEQINSSDLARLSLRLFNLAQVSILSGSLILVPYLAPTVIMNHSDSSPSTRTALTDLLYYPSSSRDSPRNTNVPKHSTAHATSYQWFDWNCWRNCTVCGFSASCLLTQIWSTASPHIRSILAPSN